MDNDSRIKFTKIFTRYFERMDGSMQIFPTFPALWMYSGYRCIPTRVPGLNSHHGKTRRDFTRRLALLNPTSSYRDYNEPRQALSSFHYKVSYNPHNTQLTFHSSFTVLSVTRRKFQFFFILTKQAKNLSPFVAKKIKIFLLMHDNFNYVYNVIQALKSCRISTTKN